MAVKEIIAKSLHFAAVQQNASGGFNHGLGYYFTSCAQGLFNIWDKIQCQNQTVSLYAFNKTSAALDINGTIVFLKVPGDVLVNGIWATINNAVNQTLSFTVGNHTQNVTLKFLNMTLLNFVNETASNQTGTGFSDLPISSASFGDPVVDGVFGAAMVAASLLSISFVQPHTFAQLKRGVREKLSGMKSSIECLIRD